MNDQPLQTEKARTRKPRRLPAVLGVATALLLIATPLGIHYFSARIPPAQPIAFSHRFHVTEKHLSCIFCHGGTIDTPRAGVPPVETCMLCHKRIIVTYPQIIKLTEYYEQKKPVPWVRVNDLPEFTFFNHQVHIRRGFDCGQCHGDVAHMDRVEYVNEFKMGFCVQCHRDNNYSHDCLICHR